MTFPWQVGAHGPFQEPGGVASEGIRAYRNVYFVDNIRGANGNVGLSINTAFATVQEALDTVQDEDTIIVFKGDGNYNEKLTTGQNIRYAAMVPGRGRNVTLAGATSIGLPYNGPQLYNVDSTEYSLFVRSPSWRVTGFRIVGDSTAPRCLVAEMAQAGNSASTNWAPGLQLDHCMIYGAVGSCSGLSLSAMGQCRVLDNKFLGFSSSTLAALDEETEGTIVTRPGFTFPDVAILRNEFVNNVLNIQIPGKECYIAYNSVGQNTTNALGSYGGIDLDGGSGNNIVTLNVLAGAYNSTGQYRRAAATDDWGGNIVTGGVINGVINPPFTSTHPGQ